MSIGALMLSLFYFLTSITQRIHVRIVCFLELFVSHSKGAQWNAECNVQAAHQLYGGLAFTGLSTFALSLVSPSALLFVYNLSFGLWKIFSSACCLRFFLSMHHQCLTGLAHFIILQGSVFYLHSSKSKSSRSL